MKHQTQSIRPFIGSKNYEQSQNFYRDLGCEVAVLSHNMSVVKMGSAAFYLQDAYVKDWIDNTMVFVEVDDASRYFDELSALDLPGKFPDAKLIPVRTEPWGRECFLIDPSGILWHFGEFFNQ